MLKMSQPTNLSSNKPSGGNKNNVEELIFSLCSKIASSSQLGDEIKAEFTNSSYAYMLKLFCSDAYTPSLDTFEVSHKIKKKCKILKPYLNKAHSTFFIQSNFQESNT